MGKNRLFSEDSRVKVPALVHMTRLGYHYRSTKEIRQDVDTNTNIYRTSFLDAINRLNQAELEEEPLTSSDAKSMIRKIEDMLIGEDLGRTFYRTLQTGITYRNLSLRLIDFDRPDNNTFEVVTEMPCGSKETSFRPDITVYINGLPLAFIEAKIPNNKDGMQAEYRRMIERSTTKVFRPYINETQLMIFSNNMEYNDAELRPVCGAFYATSGYGSIFFSHFREEEKDIIQTLPQPINEDVQKMILRDTNMVQILPTPEYATNQRVDTPTNRILTSMLSKERFLYLLHYGINYVERTKKGGILAIEKHIMRYQQLFASKAITRCVSHLQDPSVTPRGGVIWHTQGSGKTELAYYCVKILTDWFAALHISAKFYFIVDRLDLMTQAANEFRSRGLTVVEVPSRKDFIKNIQAVSEQTTSGGLVINIVNIQKFSDESVTEKPTFNVNIQRVYFVDEAHRDLREGGEYLTHLMTSDKDAIRFALTGTPLIGKVKTKDLFGDYIHKYYYNMSIKDGYTLRLIREGIKTTYRVKLAEAHSLLEDKVQKGLLKKQDITCQPEYVQPLVDYIESDFRGFRLITEDETLKLGAPPVGGIIVCDSSEQAVAVHEEIERRGNFSSVLVLSTIGEAKEELMARRDAFKRGEKDLLVVYMMLLTGFDAPRMKKMYLGRKIKEHNLLQALTRVNRPYSEMRYGYVVDFADIRKEFDKTNQAYLRELKEELGDEFEQYSGIFTSEEEIQQELRAIRDTMFTYDTSNLENFEQQIDAIDDKKQLYPLREALTHYKELSNLAGLFGYKDILQHFDKERARHILAIIERRIETLNDIERAQNTEDMNELIKAGMAHLEVHFKKIDEGELALADNFMEYRNRVFDAFASNHDQKDPVYLKLLDELKRVLKNHNIEEMTIDEMNEQKKQLDPIMARMKELNASNKRLEDKYGGDEKFMRIHKQFQKNTFFFPLQQDLFDVLSSLKHEVDDTILENSHILDNPSFFEKDVKKNVMTEISSRVPSATKDFPSLMKFTESLCKSICEEYVAV